MEQDGCFVIWRDVPGYIYHIRRGRDCLAISILCTYIATVPGKHTSVSLETSSCHSVCTHYVVTSTMLSLLWLCNVTKYLPIYFTANSVSALKDSICIFECELTCVYRRAQGRAPSTSMKQIPLLGRSGCLCHVGALLMLALWPTCQIRFFCGVQDCGRSTE